MGNQQGFRFLRSKLSNWATEAPAAMNLAHPSMSEIRLINTDGLIVFVWLKPLKTIVENIFYEWFPGGLPVRGTVGHLPGSKNNKTKNQTYISFI